MLAFASLIRRSLSSIRDTITMRCFLVKINVALKAGQRLFPGLPFVPRLF
jgi:hypothetical protein